MLLLLLAPLPYLAVMSSSTPDPVEWLVNYGVAGVVIALMVLGRLRTKAEVDGLKEQNEQLRADLLAERGANAALVAQVTGHTLPQMAQLSEVLDRVPSAQAQVLAHSGEKALQAQM